MRYFDIVEQDANKFGRQNAGLFSSLIWRGFARIPFIVAKYRLLRLSTQSGRLPESLRAAASGQTFTFAGWR
jgi:hypothetical protein